MTDLPTQVKAALAERYPVERELGQGGMATVYLAHDRKHNRDVAIKVLRPELAAVLGSERFVAEIKTTANLQHPHILPLFDSGIIPVGRGTEAVPYYVMPFFEGESLRDRLNREKQLPVEDALRIADDVAGALAYAHDRGIVHRDIKPENILLSAGEAIVADFGIARAIDRAGGERLTETGLAIGTAAYMSPEQATASHDLDGRSDTYSLGCVLYEMLAGHPPFLGASAKEVIARHTLDPVPPLRSARVAISPVVEVAIIRALAKEPADRFSTARQFAQALTARAAPPPVPRQVSFRIRHLAWTGVTLGLIVTASALYRRLLHPRGSVLPTANVIAVLPFAPLTPDTALERLGGNLVVTLSANLQGVGDIRTIDALTMLAQTQDRADAYATLDQAAALGRRLGASGIVHGTLARDGPNIRLDFGLFTSDSAAPVARTFVTAREEDIAALTDSATWALLRQVWRARVPPTPSITAITTHSLPALRAYVDGEQAIVENRWFEAQAAFDRALAEDSTFWLAHFRYTYTQDYTGQGRDRGPIKQLLAAHLADFPERERMLVAAWLHVYGEEGIALGRELTERFPDFWPGWFDLGDVLVHAGPLVGHPSEEARAAMERVLELNPRLTSAWEHLWMVALAVGDATEADRLHSFAFPGDTAAPLGPVAAMNLQLRRGGAFEGPLADSVVTQVVSEANPVNQSFSGTMFVPGPHQIELSRRVLQRGALPQVAAFHRKGLALAWAARGTWDSALRAIEAYAERAPRELAGLSADEVAATQASGDLAQVDAYRLAVLGAWLGALPPESAPAQRQTALEAVARLAPERGAELAWFDGILAATQGDLPGVRSARQRVRMGDTALAAMFERSLGAFELHLSGHAREAADSLAAVCWLEPWTRRFWGGPYFFGINRLAAARWLEAKGDLDQASRLLLWPQAWVSRLFKQRSLVFMGPTHLELGRIEAARGNDSLARVHYERFLRWYDLPSVSVRHLADEAQAALARIEGTGEGRRVR